MKCLICGDGFRDKGNHPLTCGKLDCVQEASDNGWWELDKAAIAKLRFPGQKIKTKKGVKNDKQY